MIFDIQIKPDMTFVVVPVSDFAAEGGILRHRINCVCGGLRTFDGAVVPVPCILQPGLIIRRRDDSEPGTFSRGNRDTDVALLIRSGRIGLQMVFRIDVEIDCTAVIILILYLELICRLFCHGVRCQGSSCLSLDGLPFPIPLTAKRTLVIRRYCHVQFCLLAGGNIKRLVAVLGARRISRQMVLYYEIKIDCFAFIIVVPDRAVYIVVAVCHQGICIPGFPGRLLSILIPLIMNRGIGTRRDGKSDFLPRRRFHPAVPVARCAECYCFRIDCKNSIPIVQLTYLEVISMSGLQRVLDAEVPSFSPVIILRDLRIRFIEQRRVCIRSAV